MNEPSRADARPFLDRLAKVRARLEGLAGLPAPRSLTEPDARTGERWDWGQVWAHTAEFPGYWMDQVRRSLATGATRPVPFGRVAADPGRIKAIEDERTTPPPQLWIRISRDLDELGGLIWELDEPGWQLEGLHSTLGVMSMPRILNEFLVGHLEGHAEQLEGLMRADPGPQS